MSDHDDGAGESPAAEARAGEAADLRGKPRTPVIIAVAVAAILPFFLPEKFLPGPSWLYPLVVGALLAAMLIADPGRIDRHSAQVRGIRIALITVLVLGAAWATIWLTVDIIDGGKLTNSPSKLLAAGSIVLIDLVIAFAFLYWELDSGGPGKRANVVTRYPDLAFPQHMNPDITPPGWRPIFVDYLYLGVTNALAFSPTDVMPLTHWAKLAMATQSMASLAVLGLVVARAVNVLN